MPPAGFESAVPMRDRLQTLALDRSATEIGTTVEYPLKIRWRNLTNSFSNYDFHKCHLPSSGFPRAVLSVVSQQVKCMTRNAYGRKQFLTLRFS